MLLGRAPEVMRERNGRMFSKRLLQSQSDPMDALDPMEGDRSRFTAYSQKAGAVAYIVGGQQSSSLKARGLSEPLEER